MCQREGYGISCIILFVSVMQSRIKYIHVSSLLDAQRALFDLRDIQSEVIVSPASLTITQNNFKASGMILCLLWTILNIFLRMRNTKQKKKKNQKPNKWNFSLLPRILFRLFLMLSIIHIHHIHIALEITSHVCMIYKLQISHKKRTVGYLRILYHM